jgi:membrane fusion protein, copper/silver efflux system
MKHLIYAIWILVLLIVSCNRNDEVGHHVQEDTVKAITASPSELVASSQRAIKPKMITASSGTRINGYIRADESRHNKVSVRVGGRIEKLYARFNYQFISEGSPVMEIYSPELNTAAEEYLLLHKGDTEPSLLDKGREKLRLLGLSNTQIGNIEKSGTVPRTFTVYSSHSGYLFPGDATALAQPGSENTTNTGMSAMGSGMSEGSTAETSYATTTIREGAYVNRGQTLFMVNDMQQVWAMLNLDPGMSAEKGDSVLLHFGEGTAMAMVDFIEPFYKQGQKFTRARVYLDNSKRQYKLNDLFTAEIMADGTNTYLAVPTQSVLDLGQRKIVWVKAGVAGEGKNLYKATFVTTGKAANGYIEILSGLEADQEIAEVAGFMVDSESLIER